MKRIIVIIVIAALVFIFFPSEKKRISSVIDKGRAAIINEDPDSFMDIVALSYKDDFGGSYLYMKKRVEQLFRRFDGFEVGIDNMGTTLEDKTAIVDLRVSMIASEGENRAYLIGDAGGHQAVKLFFVKEPYNWKLERIEGIFSDN
jgi:hypothetical protein